jgi:xanthine dehydrogenase accessory factor
MRARDPLGAFLARHAAVARVRLARVSGSSPREAGAEMFVAPDAVHGTIGGGQLEYMAIDHARAMLAAGRSADRMDVPLGPEIGQCCGGRVEVTLQRMDAAARAEARAAHAARDRGLPHVHVLGAGHVGRALAGFLAHLPVRTILIDSRPEELHRCTAAVELRQSVLPEADIRKAPPGSAFVVLTHDHGLDFLLTAEALARRDAAYVGLIGSATKRARFDRFQRDTGGTAPAGALTCPIGAGRSTDKRPEVIAAFVAAEVMAVLTGTAAAEPRPGTAVSADPA